MLIVGVAGVIVPLALMWTSRWRFGGASPLHGVTQPGGWSADGLRSSLSDPVTDRMLADIAIRLALLVAWAAAAMFVLTVVAEAAHMVRHGGHHLPDMRGRDWSQRSARAVAAGLLVLLPLLSHGSTAIARTGDAALLVRPSTVAVIAPVMHQHETTGLPRAPMAAPNVGEYVVRAGDSVFGIASDVAGPDEDAVAAYAEQILDLNLGREMAGGERFTNPGLIDVGWVLHLPSVEPAAPVAVPPADARHVVVPGESLWSIANDELGDPTRWPELFDDNLGRTFQDGRTFDDPALVRPGWDLIVSVGASQDAVPAVVAAQEVSAAVVTPVRVEHDARHADSVAWEAPEPAPSEMPVVSPNLPEHVKSPERVNSWMSTADPDTVSSDPAGGRDRRRAPRLLTIRRAVMLAGGVLTLVAVRRRRRLRGATPRSPPSADRPGEHDRAPDARSDRRRTTRGVDLAARAAALPLIESGERLVALLVDSDGAVEMVASGPAELSSMWRGSGDRWTLPASVPLDVIAQEACGVNAPCPTLVQLGVGDQGRDVFVDLEAIGALEIGGSAAEGDAIVAAVAATLAGSVLAEVTTLVSVAVAADAFLGHRLHSAAPDVDAALELACAAVGAMPAMAEPVFALRARGTAGESWDPAVVLVGSEGGRLVMRRQCAGLAVVSACPIQGPSSTLRPDGDAWLLRPLGLRLSRSAWYQTTCRRSVSSPTSCRSRPVQPRR